MHNTKHNEGSMKQEAKKHLGTDGKPMTAWQIWLKRLCWVVLGYSVLLLLFAGVMLAIGYAGRFETLEPITLWGQTFKPQDIGTMLGISALLGAVLNAVLALLGIRGAKDPKKIALFFWVILIDAVLTAWALASSITSGIIDPTSIVSGLFIIALAVCAWQVRKQTGYFDSKANASE